MSADDGYDYGVPEPDPVVLPFDAGERARARGALNPPPSTQPIDQTKAEYDSWAPIDLNDPQWDEPARAPDLHELLYSGLRHLFSGPPEATKTLILYEACLRLARARRRVAIIDFEMGPRRAKLLLRELGATPDELALILFIAPETPPTDALEAVIAWEPVLVVIDAALGAFQASGLDDNNRGDVEQYAATWIAPLWRAGIATAAIDHVTKNAETRGGFAIGSERKGGFVDVHIGLTIGEKRALTRGGRATVQADVHKDRPAFLRRPTSYFIDIVSHELTHELELTYRQPEAMPHTETGAMRPTIKMDQASKWLAKHPEGASKSAIADAIGGKRPTAFEAINTLIREGYFAEAHGSRNSLLITMLEPYSKDTDPGPRTPTVPSSSHQFPSSSGNRSADQGDRVVPTSSPLSEGERVRELLEPGGQMGEGGSSSPREPGTTQHHDPDELQRLLELYDDDLGGDA